MDQLTIRRWVAGPPEVVWHRILDLHALVEDDPALDLADLTGHHPVGAVPGLGACATVTRRVGARIERTSLRVEARVEPAHLTLGVTARRERWVVTVTVAPLPGDDGCGSDVRLHAVRDGAAPHRRTVRGRRHRSAELLGALLDALAHQVTTPLRPGRHAHAGVDTGGAAAAVAGVGSDQRIAAGR